jgi:alpha-ribazole phosphatase
MSTGLKAQSSIEQSGSSRIYLLRHGAIQSPGEGKRYIGWQDHPLSDLGRRQAHAWANYFNSRRLEGIHCSDLSRCLETARIVAARCSLEPRALQGLREVNLGAWDGQRFDEVRSARPQEFQRRGEHIADHRPPGGESFSDLQYRVWSIFTKLSNNPNQPSLIVTHAGVIRVLLCRLLGMPLKNLFRIGLSYGSLSIIDIGRHGYRVDAVNLPAPGCEPTVFNSSLR